MIFKLKMGFVCLNKTQMKIEIRNIFKTISSLRKTKHNASIETLINIEKEALWILYQLKNYYIK